MPITSEPRCRAAFKTQTVLLGAILLFFFYRQIHDYDVWFHMVVGREMLATGALPKTMFYLLPLQGEPTNYIEWGFGLIQHLAYTVAGFPGMALLNAALATSALLFAYAAALGRRAWLHPAALLALAIVAWAFRVRTEYRAEMLLFLALGITFWALERFMASGRWRQLIPIPLSALVLSQAHPSSLMLVPLIGAYGIEALRAPPTGLSRLQASVALAGSATAALLLACLNPYGWSQVALPVITHLADLNNPDLLYAVTEYQPIMATAFGSTFIVLVLLSIPAVLFAPRHRIAAGLLLTLFGGLTYLYARNIGLFALMLVIPLVRLALHAWPQTLPAWLTRVAMAAPLVCLIAFPLWRGDWGSGLVPKVFPEQAASYLRSHVPGARVFNFIDYGGYLAWALGREASVFADSHDTAMNRAADLHDRIFQAEPGWQNALASYRIDAIFAPTLMSYSGRLIDLMLPLAKDDNWQLVSVEDAGLLFVRSSLAPARAIDKREIWRHMLVAAQRIIDDFPNHPQPWLARALALEALGDFAQARQSRRRFDQLSYSERAQ
ncbi:MAG: hypothetical protein IBX54_14220 [Rhodoferax sp.]|nr:hypothetical protein [Rhodoferax sp.]